MYAAAIAVAIVSKRSATVTTSPAAAARRRVGSSSSPSPVDFAIVAGVSPSMMKRIVASGAKPSCVTTSSALPNRSSTSDAPATSCSSRSGWSLDRLERGLDPRVVRAARDDDADLPRQARSASSSRCVLRRSSRAARRPTTSASRSAEMPVAGPLRRQHLERRAPRPPGWRPSRHDRSSRTSRAPGRATGRAPSGRCPAPPRPARTPSTSRRSSSGVSDAWWSGP